MEQDKIVIACELKWDGKVVIRYNEEKKELEVADTELLIQAEKTFSRKN